MLSIERCKKILNKGDRKYTDSEVKEIRELLYKLAHTEYELFTKLKLHERNHLYQSIN